MYSETLGYGLSDNFHFGGREYSETALQNRGYSEDFGPKFQPLQQAHASQIVSHILRMWRLIIRSGFLNTVSKLRFEIKLIQDKVINTLDIKLNQRSVPVETYESILCYILSQ